LASSCFQVEGKKRKIKKKNHKEEKKMQRREGAYLQALTLPFHFWLPLLGSCFYPFISSTFSLASFSSQAKGKKKRHKEKKNHREEKKCKKGKVYTSHFCIWDEVLLLLSPLHIPST
jgi:hypothetical protein